MSKQTINVGSSANDGTGDKNRVAFQKINANFTELYDAIPTTQQYKFLLSQSGGDDPQTATSGSLTQGVTYEIVAFETGDDFIPSGAPNNTVGTKWIANGVAPTWGNGSELGWNNGVPVMTDAIGTNQIGNFWFEFLADGVFYCKSDGLFTVGKTYIDIGSHYLEGGFIFARDLNINEFIIESQEPSGQDVNGLINNTSFEIIINN